MKNKKHFLMMLIAVALATVMLVACAGTPVAEEPVVEELSFAECLTSQGAVHLPWSN